MAFLKLKLGDKITYNYYGKIKSGVICGSNNKELLFEAVSKYHFRTLHRNWLKSEHICYVNDIKVNTEDEFICENIEPNFTILKEGFEVISLKDEDNTVIENGYFLDFKKGQVYICYDSGSREYDDDEDVIYECDDISLIKSINGVEVMNTVKCSID